MVADKIRCSKQVYPNDRWGSFHGHQCIITKNIVMRDGKPYCKIHDPVKEAAKQKERQKKWEEENKKEKEDYRRQKAMIQACQDVSTKILETINVSRLLEAAKNAYRAIILGDGKKIDWQVITDELQQAISQKGEKKEDAT